MKDKINEMRANGESDAQIARFLNISRQRVGQLAGTRRTNPTLSSISNETKDSVVKMVQDGHKIVDIAASNHLSVGSIRYILAGRGVVYDDFKIARFSRKVDDLKERAKRLFAEKGVNLTKENIKTTFLIGADRKLYVAMMRVARIHWWKDNLTK